MRLVDQPLPGNGQLVPLLHVAVSFPPAATPAAPQGSDTTTAPTETVAVVVLEGRGPGFKDSLPLQESILPVPSQESTSSHSGSTGHSLWMWVYLGLFCTFAAIQAIFLRMPAAQFPDQDVSNGSFLLAFVLGEIFPCAFIMGYWARFIRARQVRWRHLFVGAGAGALNMLGITALVLLNASGGETSVLTPLTSLYIVVPVIMGVLCMGDHLTPLKLLGILLAVGASLLFAFGGGSSFEQTGGVTAFILFLLIFIGWGFCTPLYQVLSTWETADTAASYVTSIATFLVVGTLAAVSMGELSLSPFLASHAFNLAAGACHALANISFVKFSSTMPSDASSVAPLASFYAIIPVTVGMMALNEAVTAAKIVGAVVALAAVILLGRKSKNDIMTAPASAGPHLEVIYDSELPAKTSV